jgi:hypothetical protein
MLAEHDPLRAPRTLPPSPRALRISVDAIAKARGAPKTQLHDSDELRE